MRKALLLFVLVPSVAFAEDCSCLDDRHLTKECIAFSYTDEFLECQNVPDDRERIADLEDKTERLEAQVRKILKGQRKGAK